jgi:hypothetical protein
MFAFTLLILMAWFVQMPLWLSITTTVVSSIVIGMKFVTLIIEIIKATHEI